MRRPAPAFALVLLACSPRTGPGASGLSVGDDPTTTSTGAGTSDATTGATGVSTTPAAASSAASDVSGTDGATSSPKDDLGGPDMGDVEPACNGKIDVIFVLPTPGSPDFEATMASSRSAFVDTLTSTLAGFDLHVMVIDPDGLWGSPYFCPESKCPADGPCPALEDPSYPCWALHDGSALSKCDDTRGAGVTFPAGEWASNVRCGVPEGRRFLTNSDADFADDFHCIATLGGADGSQRAPQSLMRAVSADLQYGCNAGFLREDALLLAFLISVTDYSEYGPAVWADAVLEAKGGDQDKVVVMTVASDRSTEEPLCPGPKVDEPHDVYKFSMLFEHGLLGSLCATDYGPYFEEAAALAAELCDTGPQG